MSGHVPQPHGAIAAAVVGGYGHDLAVRAEGHIPSAAMDGEWGAVWTMSGYVPQPHGAIETADRQGLAVRAERHRVDVAGVGVDRGTVRVVGGHVPQPHGAVQAADSQSVAVWAERH